MENVHEITAYTAFKWEL